MTDDQDRLLAELVNHPAWGPLKAKARTEMERRFRVHTVALMTGHPVSEETIAYDRGFFAGMKFLLDKPRFAQADIERELAKREEVKLDA